MILPSPRMWWKSCLSGRFHSTALGARRRRTSKARLRRRGLCSRETGAVPVFVPAKRIRTNEVCRMGSTDIYPLVNEQFDPDKTLPETHFPTLIWQGLCEFTGWCMILNDYDIWISWDLVLGFCGLKSISCHLSWFIHCVTLGCMRYMIINYRFLWYS